jgi:UDP-GlcNAc:undecaprenyl-phosphate GlcNAc-1-phosphate transferase
MYVEISVAFLVTSACLWALRPLALNAGLVDRPGGHKIHDGEIPLIGGIAMYLGVVAALLLFRSFPEWEAFLISSGLLLVIGAVDDYRELRVTIRVVVQLGAGLIMAIVADNVLVSLGDLFGTGDVELGGLAIPFTLLCVIGVINAMNMSDGMDGLAGSLALITVLLIMVMVALRGDGSVGALALFPAVLVPFLIVNLCGGNSCGRAFMGDAGSTFLGFALAWILIAYSQGDDAVYRPVTALWLMAVPLIDTVSLMIRRVLKGRSPFLPDRQHFHHVLLAAGLGTRQTLAVVVVLALLLGGVGIAGELAGVPEWQMAAAFVILGFLYLFAVQHAWRVKRAIGRLLA